MEIGKWPARLQGSFQLQVHSSIFPPSSLIFITLLTKWTWFWLKFILHGDRVRNTQWIAHSEQPIQLLPASSNCYWCSNEVQGVAQQLCTHRTTVFDHRHCQFKLFSHSSDHCTGKYITIKYTYGLIYFFPLEEQMCVFFSQAVDI
jgi:hypothetical protein